MPCSSSVRGHLLLMRNSRSSVIVRSATVVMSCSSYGLRSSVQSMFGMNEKIVQAPALSTT